MPQPKLAVIEVFWHRPAPGRPNPARIPVQYNPTELAFERSNQLAEINIPGLDAPIIQFVRGQSETLTLELFFDTTDEGMGASAVSVTTKSDLIYQLAKIEPSRHAPPVCRFLWNDKFPGSDVSAQIGNQIRNGFTCIFETVRHRYTLFSPQGVPLRATMTVTLREYKTLSTQLHQLGLNSPDKTQVHVLEFGETLASIAGKHYDDPGEWRRLAEANGIEDPRRLTTGMFLTLPPIN